MSIQTGHEARSGPSRREVGARPDKMLNMLPGGMAYAEKLTGLVVGTGSAKRAGDGPQTRTSCSRTHPSRDPADAGRYGKDVDLDGAANQIGSSRWRGPEGACPGFCESTRCI